jgi:hypothetical protein
MYAQQMAKGRAALAKGVYGDLLSMFIYKIDLGIIMLININFKKDAYVYGTIGRTIPAAYPTSPGFFQMPCK